MSLLEIKPAAAYADGQTGAFADLRFDAYRAADAINKSGLDTLRDNPRRFNLERRGVIQRTATAAMQYGTILHEMILFGRRDFHIQPETYGPDAKPWSGNAKECRQWKIEHDDQPILTLAQSDQAEIEALCVRENADAAKLLRGNLSELSIFARAEGTGHMLKARLDHYGEDQSGPYFVDIKTTIDASTSALSREIHQRRYHVQFALYRLILRRLGLDDCRVYIIALEKGDLPRCNVRLIAGEALDLGESQLESDLALYRQFRRADWWPDFSDEEPDRFDIKAINLPDYVLARSEALTGMTPVTA